MVHPAPGGPPHDPARAARRIMSDDNFNIGILYRGSRPAYRPTQSEKKITVADLEREFAT